MPTKSTNIGGRGGARPGAGRKRKKMPSGIMADEQSATVLKFQQENSSEVPKPSDFLTASQAVGKPLQAKEIYEFTWEWLKKAGCADEIPAQSLERYAMCSARWIQCEEFMSEQGLLSEHPTTGKPIPSPYVNIGLNYLNQATRLWSEIYGIVKEICAANHSDMSQKADPMERLLRARSGS
ncbi:MAG: terminase [Lachnospiraceae bacterium]|nr:terminase [Lachnospiraceae bacterium]